MSETNLTEPSFQIQRIYLKDLSLEQPNTPAILLVQAEPQMQVEVDIGIARLSDGLFEVMLSGTVYRNACSAFLYDHVVHLRIDTCVGGAFK